MTADARRLAIRPPEPLAARPGLSPVSLSGETTQTAPTTGRWGRPPGPSTSLPCRGPVTSTTSGSSLMSPAVPTWASTYPHSGGTGGAPGRRLASRAGPARHAHLTEIGGRIERCHHHCHLCALARSAHERSRQAWRLRCVEPQPVVFHQEPHHRQSRSPSAAHRCDTCGVAGAQQESRARRRPVLPYRHRATLALAEVKCSPAAGRAVWRDRWEPPSWAVAGATLAVAALFPAGRRGIQAMVDRRFNRRKYDAAKTVEAFSARLREQVDLDTLSSELLGVVDQTMEPTRASLWIRPSVEASAHSRG
jgi:hypothetical protein